MAKFEFYTTAHREDKRKSGTPEENSHYLLGYEQLHKIFVLRLQSTNDPGHGGPLHVAVLLEAWCRKFDEWLPREFSLPLSYLMM